MITKTKLIAWLNTLPANATVAIDEDGMALVCVTTFADPDAWPYLEVGGMPDGTEHESQPDPVVKEKTYAIEREASTGTLSYLSRYYSPDNGHEMWVEFRIAAHLREEEARRDCAWLNARRTPDVWEYRVVENTNSTASR
jgi:hypothetical protein